MKIGLLGGSFNPPHEGHRQISLIALRRLKLDKVWWIVTPGNPLKSHNDLAPLDSRVAWCDALADHPSIEITDFERDRQSSYTFETLQYVRRRYSRTNFVWLMGADNLVTFHKWKRWQDIMDLMPIAVINRPGFHYQALNSRFATFYKKRQLVHQMTDEIFETQSNAWCFLFSKLYAISSTEIRKSMI